MCVQLAGFPCRESCFDGTRGAPLRTSRLLGLRRVPTRDALRMKTLSWRPVSCAAHSRVHEGVCSKIERFHCLVFFFARDSLFSASPLFLRHPSLLKHTHTHTESVNRQGTTLPLVLSSPSCVSCHSHSVGFFFCAHNTTT